mmetsp:Transcript_41343/g.100325  ORF Transcript_41343/g.100325 Transcript_41343/m.100325 type:complete len:90 (+) Transcript_41343:230-499(+)
MGRDIETQSEYVLLVQNISDKTRRSDLEYEFDKAGPVRYIARIRDDETLIEFKHRKDAAWAYRNLGEQVWPHIMRIVIARHSLYVFAML